MKVRTWHVCLCLLALIYAFIAGLKTVVDFDLGWQMATGRYLLQHHALPRTELFSYTVHGVEWIYPLLSGTIFYLFYLVGGYAAISWLCALACVGCVALLIWRRGFWAVAPALLAVPVFGSEILPRASLFTLLLFTGFARVLLDYFEGRGIRLWLLPVMMMFWVNLHTGFVAGLALVAAYVAVEALEMLFVSRRGAAVLRLRRASPWLIATVLAVPINPWGYRIFVAIARQQEVVRWQSIVLEEWQPVQFASALQELNWRSPESARWWLLGFGVVVAVGCLWRRRIGPALVLVAAMWAFLRHTRMEGPCIVLVCLIGGSALDRVTENTRVYRGRLALTMVTVGLLVGLTAVRCFDLVTNRAYLSAADITLFGAGRSWWLPEEATDFLLKQHLPANVFSGFNLGSYLVWRLGEQYPDFADGRYVPFGERLFEQQRRLTGLPLDSDEWTRAADTWHIGTVIFPLSRVFALGEFPLAADCASTHWTPVYMDAFAIIFQRNPTVLPAVDCRAQNLISATKLSGGGSMRAQEYQMYANAGAVYSLLGRLPEARDAADRATNIFSGDPTLHFIRAQTATGEQKYDEAEDEFQAALKIRESDAGWYNLGLLYVHERRYSEAVDALRRSAHLSSESYRRWLLIGEVLLADQRPTEAVDAFAQADRRSPYGSDDSGPAREFRAQVAEEEAVAFMRLQQPEKAIERQRFAIEQTPQSESRRQALLEDCQAARIDCSLP